MGYKIEEIQKIDVLVDDNWDSSMLPLMNDDQIINCHRSIYKELQTAIIKLRGQKNVLDAGTKALINLLLIETKNRFQNK